MSRQNSHSNQPRNAQPQAIQPQAQPQATKSMPSRMLETNLSSTASAYVADARGSQLSSEEIRTRAYQISEARNGGPGDETTDWSQAEKELDALSKAKK